MAHRLDPTPGQRPLSPREIVDRLWDRFQTVYADDSRGAEWINGLVGALEHLRRPGGTVPVSDADLDRVKGHAARSLYVWISDEKDPEWAYLEICLIPDEPIFCVYAGPEHEREAAPLAIRCADALGYRILEI